MPESFECRKGGLIQSSLLALECEMFGSLSSSVTGEVQCPSFGVLQEMDHVAE